MTSPAEPTRARLRIRSRWAAWSSLIAKATVSSSSPSASQLIVSGDSRTFTQVMVRSRPLAPASTSPLRKPPSAIASRTVSAMGGLSMPQLGASVTEQSLLDGLHNRRVCSGLIPWLLSQPALMGLLTPRVGWLDKRGGRGRKQGGTAGGWPLVLAAERAVYQASCKEGTDGQLHDRDSRPAAPRDPGAAVPDRRGRDLHRGADGGGRPTRGRPVEVPPRPH